MLVCSLPQHLPAGSHLILGVSLASNKALKSLRCTFTNMNFSWQFSRLFGTRQQLQLVNTMKGVPLGLKPSFNLNEAPSALRSKWRLKP
jgi:hypothetical protein